MQGSNDSTPALKAKVQYLASADDDNTATYYASQAGVAEAQAHEGQFQFCEVVVENGRRKGDGFWDVDRQGVKLVHHPSTVKDFQSESEVKDIFYEEVKVILLQHVKGAKRIEIFDHTRRASTAEIRTKMNCREPSAIIHNDYTEKSAKKRLGDMLPQEAEELSKKRFAIVNLWRSIAGTVESSPLAFCDSTSIDIQKDLISVKRVAKDRIGELQMALSSPNHKWYYFPRMTADEALIFKTFDSSSCDNINKFTLHTALDGVGDVSVPRQSIEIRAFVFFSE